MTRIPLLLLLLAACGPTVTTETVTDGTACEDGGTVTFTFDTCLSSSCDALLSSSCTATLEGAVVTVRATADVERTAGTCTADCGFVTASCPMPDVADPAGVTVEIGDVTVALVDFTCEA